VAFMMLLTPTSGHMSLKMPVPSQDHKWFLASWRSPSWILLSFSDSVSQMSTAMLGLYWLQVISFVFAHVITVFTVFRLLTDFVCLYTYEFWLSLCKTARSSVILLLPLFLFASETTGNLIVLEPFTIWWVESDFKAPNLLLSLRLKVSGCHYNSIYNNTWTKQLKQLSKQRQTQWSKCQRHFYLFTFLPKNAL
jgi:hypothetical protein